LEVGFIEFHSAGELKTRLAARKTSGSFDRLRGLLGYEGFGCGDLKGCEALWLDRCNSIHTFFMRFSIDVVYLDAGGKVKKLVSSVVSYRMSGCFSARHVVEMAGGSIRKLNLEEGDECKWVK
jgi:hypothetical protein